MIKFFKFLTLIFIGILVGIILSIYHIFPYPQVAGLKKKYLNRNYIRAPHIQDLPTEEYKKINPTELISIKGPEDIDSVRQKAINLIFGTDSLPSQQPHIQSNITDERFKELTNLSRIDKFIVPLKHGLTSAGYIFIPRKVNKKLVLYHQGHEGDFVLGKKIIDTLLGRGFTIYAFTMPLRGMNESATITHSKMGKFRLLHHGDFTFLDNPLSFFIEPVIVMLNYAGPKKFEQVIMTGISGGGWTTTIAAGIDERIDLSFPVAGSYPMYIRFFHRVKDFGDWEQYYPPLFSKVDYLDFYILGASGKGRKQVQVLNKYDQCCFDGEKYLHYEDVVSETVKEHGEGEFKVYLDTTHREHKISDQALNIILEEIYLSSSIKH